MGGIKKAPQGPEACDEAAERLLEQGVEPAKVVQAKRLLRNLVRESGSAGSDPNGAVGRALLRDRQRR